MSAGASSSADRLLKAFLGFGALAKTPSTITAYGTDIPNITAVSFIERLEEKAFYMFPAVKAVLFPSLLLPISFLFTTHSLLYILFSTLLPFFFLISEQHKRGLQNRLSRFISSLWLNSFMSFETLTIKYFISHHHEAG